MRPSPFLGPDETDSGEGRVAGRICAPWRNDLNRRLRRSAFRTGRHAIFRPDQAEDE